MPRAMLYTTAVRACCFALQCISIERMICTKAEPNVTGGKPTRERSTLPVDLALRCV
jgi:hypothetical protein